MKEPKIVEKNDFVDAEFFRSKQIGTHKTKDYSQKRTTTDG
jgi:hypothetical protein